MSEWVLILTLIGSTHQSGQAIQQIPGFVAVGECLAAGNSWLEQVRGVYGRQARALCVPRTRLRTP